MRRACWPSKLPVPCLLVPSSAFWWRQRIGGWLSLRHSSMFASSTRERHALREAMPPLWCRRLRLLPWGWTGTVGAIGHCGGNRASLGGGSRSGHARVVLAHFLGPRQLLGWRRAWFNSEREKPAAAPVIGWLLAGAVLQEGRARSRAARLQRLRARPLAGTATSSRQKNSVSATTGGEDVAETLRNNDA